MQEVKAHKIIRIFLASSIDDTKEERDKLQNKILAVWNPIFKRFNTELKLFRCEQMTEEWLKRNQETIDEEIRNSDVFIVIFKNTVGNYTFHEFQVARDSYSKTSGRPRIYPYISNELIKNINQIPALQEITRDDNYPETFSVIDTIEISLLERLGKELSLRVQPHYDGTITINDVIGAFDISPQEISKAYLITQKDYIDFAVRLFEGMYKEFPFVQYNGQKFPDGVLFSDDSVRGFDRESLDFSITEHSELLYGPTMPIDENFLHELKQSHPQRFCNTVMPYKFFDFMNDEVVLSENRKINGLKMYVGPDEANVFSTLTLRDELEKLYESQERTLTPQNSPLRTSIHAAVKGDPTSAIFRGAARASAVGIQLMVLFPVKDPMKRRDRNTGRFADGNHLWIPVVKRSEHAREQPGFYQFAPCGGFRIFDEPEAAENDRNIQEQNFDFFRTILHLYVRELFNETTSNGDKFGDSKYDKPEHASLSDAALDSVYAEELCAMLQDGRADMEFLGASVSVAALKYDLVFSLVIHDQEFFLRNRKAFKSDYCAASLNIYPVEYLLQENFLHGENCLAEEIAGPLTLLSGSEQIDDDLRTKLKDHFNIS